MNFFIEKEKNSRKREVKKTGVRVWLKVFNVEEVIEGNGDGDGEGDFFL